MNKDGLKINYAMVDSFMEIFGYKRAKNISKKTLGQIDGSAKNLKNGKAGDPIEIDKL